MATGSITVATIDGSAFLPVRFLLATFGIDFYWDGDLGAVIIPAQ